MFTGRRVCSLISSISSKRYEVAIILGVGDVMPVTRQTMLLSRILAAFNGTGDEVGIERLSNTSNYFLLIYIGAGRYYSAKLTRSAGLPGGATLTRFTDLSIRDITKGIIGEHASVVRAGAGWTGASAQPDAFGGTYRYSATTGATVTWTAPVCTRVGFCPYATSNAGLMLVTIDGSTTAANALMTAQDYVNAGTFPNTILVGFGGTLNPTDRVYDQYTSAPDDGKVQFANGLPSAVHTVILTNTGYKRAASTGFRMYVTGFWYDAPAGTLLATAGTWGGTFKTQVLLNVGADMEYALITLPAGGVTDNVFTGNGHGYDHEQSTQISVNGAVVVPTPFQALGGASVTFNRVSKLRHPDFGVLDVADIVLNYTIDPVRGIRVTHSITWAMNGVVKTHFPAMLAGNEYLDKGTTLNAVQDYMLTANNDAHVANTRSQAGWVWDADGYYGLLLYIPSTVLLTVINNWTYSGTEYLNIEDRIAGNINKFYLNRVRVDEPFAIGQTWQSDFYMMGKYFPDGANLALAR